MASLVTPKKKPPLPLPHHHHAHPPLDAYPPAPPSTTVTATATATTTTVSSAHPPAHHQQHSTPLKKKLTVDAPHHATNGYHHAGAGGGLASPSAAHAHQQAGGKVSSSLPSSSSHSVIIPSPLFVRSTSSPLSSSVPSLSAVPPLSSAASSTASPLSSTPSSPIASASPSVRRFKPAPITPRSTAAAAAAAGSAAIPAALRLPTPPKTPQLFSPVFAGSGVSAKDEIPAEQIDAQLSRLKEIKEKAKHPVVPAGAEWEEGSDGVSELSLNGGGGGDGRDEMEVEAEASVATTASSASSTARSSASSASSFPSLSLSITTDLDDMAPQPPAGRGTYSQPSTPSHASPSSAADLDEFDPFLFIKHLPPLPSHFLARPPVLPPKHAPNTHPLHVHAPHAHKPLTLALDLDETLVHCSITPLPNPSLTFPVTFNGVAYHVYVRLRPHLMTFLKGVAAHYEVVIFTASQQVYADALLNLLDPHRQYIDYRVFRDSCVCVEGNYLKDLHILGRDLGRVCIVDNSIQAFGYQLDNGIPIESWYDDESDGELLDLLEFLKKMSRLNDVRPFLRDYFNLSAFVASL